MPDRLTDPELAAALAELPSWRLDGAALVRAVSLPSFRTAVDLVMAVAEVAERLDHHPDVDLRYRTVRLRLRSWDAGGLTRRDVALAQALDALLPQEPAPNQNLFSSRPGEPA